MQTKDALLVVDARAALRDGRAQELREAAGLSQGELAAVVGVSSAAYCRWESGERAPRGVAALRLGRFLRALESKLRAKSGEPAIL